MDLAGTAQNAAPEIAQFRRVVEELLGSGSRERLSSRVLLDNESLRSLLI